MRARMIRRKKAVKRCRRKMTLAKLRRLVRYFYAKFR
jgi:hypothetical protein